MTSKFPITPPPELASQWCEQFFEGEHDPATAAYSLVCAAAQWGADQELEACCKWLNGGSGIDYDTAALLRVARRSKPPSLKEQALEALDRMDQLPTLEDMHVVRRALERLQELEGGN